MGQTTWRDTGPVAWTVGDGPGRPPAGPPRRMMTSLAVALVAVFAGILSSDTLCPEHRLWVEIMAGAAFVAAAVAVVGLLRRWALAPALTAVVCALGVGIGLVDAIHAPTRGMVLAAAFGVLALACAVASYQMLRLALWDRAVARSLAPAGPGQMPTPAPSVPTATTPAADDATGTAGDGVPAGERLDA